MMKCKFYSEYTCNHYGNGLCHYDEKLFGGLPQLCSHINDFENCTCFEPTKHELDVTGVEISKLESDQEKHMRLRTLTIRNCDKIVLKPKGLEIEIKVEKDNFDDFDYIEINGHKFRRV